MGVSLRELIGLDSDYDLAKPIHLIQQRFGEYVPLRLYMRGPTPWNVERARWFADLPMNKEATAFVVRMKDALNGALLLAATIHFLLTQTFPSGDKWGRLRQTREWIEEHHCFHEQDWSQAVTGLKALGLWPLEAPAEEGGGDDKRDG